MVGRYRVLQRIGSGGMGTVYAGVDTTNGEQVALKIVHRRRAADQVFFERLRREAQAIALIDSPNVVRILGFGISDCGLPYLAMELVRGCTLAEMIAENGAVTPARASRIALGIARGLAASHTKCFIHRDLKPSNVMVSPNDRVKIVDFGIVSCGLEDQDKLTRDDVVLGTPAYMAPEQVMSPGVSPQADLYALGVILFEMLTGRPPFEGDFRQIAVFHLMQTPPPLPPCGGLETLVAQLLEKDPKKRPASAEDVVRAIEALGLHAPSARAVSAVRSTSAYTPLPRRPTGVRVETPPARPHRAHALVAAAAAVFVMGSVPHGERLTVATAQEAQAAHADVAEVDVVVSPTGKVIGGRARAVSTARYATRARVELTRAVERRLDRSVPVIDEDVASTATVQHLRTRITVSDDATVVSARLVDASGNLLGRAEVSLPLPVDASTWTRALDELAAALFPVVTEELPATGQLRIPAQASAAKDGAGIDGPVPLDLALASSNSMRSSLR